MMRSGYRRNRFHRKAPEQPLLLLFPGCCTDAASTMRIRKGQARWSSASARGESQSSDALHAATGSQDQPTPPDHPYMNLDEFVNSLARENCFPDEEFTHPYGDHHYKTGESSSLTTNFSRPSDDQPHFSRVDSRSSVKINADDVDTSLRLAISPRDMAPAADPASKMKSSEGGVTIRTTLEASEIEIAHGAEEECGQSCRMANTSEIVETTEEEVEADQPDQTMKSSTESMERRSGSRRKRVPVSVSSSPLATQDSEKRKQKAGLRGTGVGESASKRTKTKRERKASSSRSGRPKKLKYMKQENREELGNQCNRSDGKGWTCPLLAKTGYQLCDHHLDKLRCKPGSRSKYYKKKRASALS